jgi:DnaJ-class molecular chaperone
MDQPDFYRILGVARDADEATIKAAFRRQAKDLHPDAGGDPEAFRLLKLAYDILSDGSARSHYDQTGTAPPDAAERARFHAIVGDWLVASIAQAGAPQFDDVLELMRRSVRQQIAALRHRATQLASLVAKIDMVAERIHTNGRENLLQDILTVRRQRVAEEIVAVDAQRAMLERLLALSESYTYDVYVETVP